MARTLSYLDAHKALGDFTGTELGRGHRYFLQRRVLSVRLLRATPKEIVYAASVQGSQRAPYETRLVFETDTGELLETDCSCPIGGHCKHSVAALHALMAFLKEGAPASSGRGRPAAGPAGTSGASGVKSESRPLGILPRPRLDARTEQWLGALKASAVAAEPRSTRSAEPRQRFVFTLQLEEFQAGPGLLQLRVDRVTLGPDGAFGARQIVDPRRVDWGRDPAESPGDHALVVRMGAFSMGYHVLQGADGGRVLSDVVATGRAYFAAESGFLLLAPAPPRRGELIFESLESGHQRPALCVAGAAGAAAAASAASADSAAAALRFLPVVPVRYLDLASGAVGPLEVDGVPDAVVHLWIQGAGVPPSSAAEVARRITAERLPVRLPTPRVRPVRVVKAAPTLVLRLESTLPADVAAAWRGAPPPDRPWVRVLLDYGGIRIPPESFVEARVVGDEILSIARDHAAEAGFMGALADAGLVSVQRAFSGRALPSGTAMTLPKVGPFGFAPRVRAIAAALSPPARVEEAPDFGFDALLADEVSVGLDEVSGSDRLAVSVGIRVGDELVDALPLVLAALRERLPDEGESLVVPLPDGRAILVPAARLAPIRQLLVELLGERAPGEIPRGRAVALDPAVLARSPASLARLREALAKPAPIALPRALTATLRDYQREGFAWLMARRRAGLGAVLADDMGLGKTVQTLALLLAEEREGVPSLVVCPKTLLGNWEAEAQRFAPTLDVLVHHGPDRGSRVARIKGADVVITTYSLLVRDEELFASQRFATVVLDEAQAIKTASSTFTRAACALQADFRLALSGTPMENHLGELWSVLRFTLPELLGDSKSFARTFRRPIERDGSEGARAELRRRLAPFVLRRRKEQVASELPEKTVVVESIDLEDRQRDVYEAVRAAMDARVKQALAERGLAQSHIVVLDALLKMRQAVCDPRLLAARSAKKAGSAKLEVLIAKLTELVAEGRRVLVFSQFVSMLDLIEPELRKAKIPFLVLTGATENRAALVAAFQRGEAPVFLISLKAGGTGLNLTAADVVIHYDPWWNPAAEAQATDRAHRIGQDKPVLVYKLVGRGTIEEKILGMQAKKQALFTSILDEAAGAVKRLSAEDVEFLFAP